MIWYQGPLAGESAHGFTGTAFLIRQKSELRLPLSLQHTWATLVKREMSPTRRAKRARPELNVSLSMAAKEEGHHCHIRAMPKRILRPVNRQQPKK